MGKHLYWLSDVEWAKIEPLLPRGRRGAHRVDGRRVISGIIHMLKTGARCGTVRSPMALTPRSITAINALRRTLVERGAETVIPSTASRKVSIPHDRDAYRQRNLIERMFCCLKDFRRIATRYDKLARNYAAAVHIAAIAAFWLN